MTDTRTAALDEKARAELRRPAKVKWASWKQLNRAARTMAEMLELEYAPDADTAGGDRHERSAGVLMPSPLVILAAFAFMFAPTIVSLVAFVVVPDIQRKRRR